MIKRAGSGMTDWLFDLPMPWLLLSPNIPKPMHGLNPRTLLGKEWWDRQRQIAYAHYGYCCWACGTHKSVASYHHWLEGHEAYEINYQTGRMYLVRVVALCHSCHNAIHDGRMRMMVMSGEMTHEKMEDILEHKSRVLKGMDYNHIPLWLSNTLSSLYTLTREMFPASKEVDWEDWRLVIDGEEYPPIYKSRKDWFAHYQGGDN